MEETVKIDVVFRILEDEIIAFMPSEKADFDGNIMSYMRIGQHSGADPELIFKLSKPTYTEYQPLLDELISIGYDVNVISDREVVKLLPQFDRELPF